MKKRRTLIVAFVLIAALCLGIGYAGFTSTLLVNGEAILGSTETSKVVISNIEIDTAKANTAGIKIDDPAPTGLNTNTAGFTAKGFSKIGDIVYINVTISNPHEFDVKLTEYKLTVTNNDIPGGEKFFSITNVESGTYVAPTEVAAKGTVVIPVIIKLTGVTADAHTTNFTVSVSATTR